KEGLKSRKDFVDLNIRHELHPEERANGKYELCMDNEDEQEEWIMKLHKLHFGPWLKKESIEDDGSIDAETVKMLARGPASLFTSWQGYDINGWTFYTKQKDMKSKSQNSGICTESLDSAANKNTYYGFIEDIIELDYGRNLQIPVFKCKWAREIGR